MSFLKVKNRAISTLASGVSDVATEWTVATGEGALFPSSGDFHITCEDEIAKCTSRTGDVLTVTRAQEGTAAAAHDADKAVKLRITAAIIEALQIQLLDADGDTGFEVEQSADEDKIHGKVAGVEAFLLNNAGILTLAKQSGAFVELGTDQSIPHNSATRLCLDNVIFDIQSEVHSTVKSGAADATEANKLHDADGGFAASDVGAWIWNTTDDTYTQVTGFVDSGELDLEDDIMADGENYKLYHAKFTVTEAGLYLLIAVVRIDMIDAKMATVYLRKNNSALCDASVHGSHTRLITGWCLAISQASANDYYTVKMYQDTGSSKTAYAVHHSYFAILKIA